MKSTVFESDYARGTTLFLAQTDDGDIIVKTRGDGEMRIATSGGKMHGRDLVECVGGFAKAIDAINNAQAHENAEKPEDPKKWSVWSVLKKLEAYEKTGLTPEEIITLKSTKSWDDAVEREYLKFVELEKDGRLITLPCKVTDTVYVLETVYKGKKAVGERVVSAQIDRVIIGGTTGEPVYDLCSETGNWYKSMMPEDFYLTAEEAEKAVKEG